MAKSTQAQGWLKSPLGTTLLAQVSGDPGLPQPNSTTSAWQLPPNPDVAFIQSPTLPETTDYLVIGSGITGCGVTKTLLEHPASGSKTVTVLEARGLCSGATGRNGGQLVKPYPLRYIQLAEDFGLETADKITRMALRTLEEMHKLAASYDEDLKAQAIARRVTKVIVYVDPESWERAQKAVEVYEARLPEECGLFKKYSAEELASKWNVKGGYGGYSFPAGVCWPYRLVTGVFKRLLDKHPNRLNVETKTPVTTILYDAKTDPAYPYVVTTPRGIIRTATLVHCTNGHIGHLLPLMRGKIHPIRGTMSAQAPGPNFPNLTNLQSWTFLSDPHYNAQAGTLQLGWFYGLQNPPNGDVWIGGEDKRVEEVFTADDSTIGKEGRANLSGILTKSFNEKWMPAPAQVRNIWTGVMAQTGDTIPFVGKLPSSVTARPGDGEWVAGGWNSYGMTNGLTSGEAVARMILGEEPPEWFPRAYLPTEERLAKECMAPESVVASFMEWSGIGPAMDKELPKSKL